jgi:RNA polymerase sigma factor FliA
MNSVLAQTAELADLLDIVDIALATISRRLPAAVARDDLASAGKLALVVAVAQCAGTPDEVRAYCFVRVRGAILDELRRLDPLCRRHRALAALVARVVVALEARLGRSPTDHEVAVSAQIPAVDVAAVRLAAAHTAQEIEWDCIPDDEAASPADSTERADVQACLRAALDRLPANQALALRRYYLEDATLDDIAAELRVSRERARQVREAGEKKLRNDLLVLSLWQALVLRPT